MSINWWSNWVNDSSANIALLCQLSNLILIFISQFNNFLITKSSNKVSFNYCWENRETMLDISEVVKSINVDTCDFNFISWASRVYLVILENYLLLTWYPTWWNSSWCLLDSQFLIVSIDSVYFIYWVGTCFLTNNAST